MPRTRRHLTFASAVMTLAQALPAASQTVEAPVPSSTPARIEDVTVYGTRDARPVFTFPGMVTVVNRDTIETRLPSDAYDILRTVPGVDVGGGPRRTGQAPSIRGLGGQRTQILIDGTRQNFQSAHDGRLFIEPELLRSIEVVRGPTSALYGSGAIGGVIAFDTNNARDMLRPGETVGALARAGYRDVNHERFGTLTVFGARDGFDAVGSITRRHGNDIRRPDSFVLPADDDITSGLAKLSYGTADFGVTGQFLTYRGNALEPDNGQGNAVASAATPLFDKDIQQDLGRGELRFHPEAAPYVNVRVVPYVTRTTVGETQTSGGTRFVSREVETTGVVADNRTRFEVMPGLGGTLIVGLDIYRNSYAGFDSTGTNGTRDGVPNAESRYVGSFAQVDLRADQPLGLPGHLTIIPGLRYDTFTSSRAGLADNTDEALSPKIGISYQPLPWLLAFASYGQGFRAPGVEELYLGGTHFRIPVGGGRVAANTFVPNPDLRPERATSIEGGLGVDFRGVLQEGDRLRAKASIYANDVDNLIEQTVIGGAPIATCFRPPFFPCDAGTTTTRNIAGAILRGVEVEASYISRTFDVTMAYSSVTGRDSTTGLYISTLSPDRLFIDAAAKIPDWNLRLGARVTIADDFTRVATPAQARAGYELLDLYLVWQPTLAGLDGVRFDLGVDNVFDRRYERVAAGVVEPGRNLKAAVSYRVAF